MKTTTRESIAIFLAGLLLLSSFTTPATACCEPPAPPCYRCEAGVLVWDCGSNDNCCNGSCCPNRCCNDVCCSCPTAECCGFDHVCCYNSCCNLTCCDDPEEHCCGGHCCSNACCSRTCCDPGESCCSSICCISGCCSVTGACCGITGDECCDDRICYDPATEKCCGNGDGHTCLNEQTCCGDFGCCLASQCCDEGVCEALEGCESCINGVTTDDKDKCPGECKNCTDAQCHDDDSLCDPGDVCVNGTCCDTAWAGNCFVTAEDLDYAPENCLPLPGGQCGGGPGSHIAVGWEQAPTHQDQEGPGTVDVDGCADVTYAQCTTYWDGGFGWQCLLDDHLGNITKNFGTHEECPSE